MSDKLQRADSDDFTAQPSPINDSESTELHQEIKLPWQDTFKIGMGIDALTGESRVSPFEEVEWTPYASERNGLEVAATSQLIRHCHELHHDFNVDSAITVNPCSFAAVGTGLEYLRSWKVSSSATLVESKISGHYPFDNPPKKEFKLTKEASECLKNTPEKFRDRYGDYFIHGVRSGFSFHAVFKSEDEKKTDVKSIRTKASTAIGGVLDVLQGGGQSDSETSDLVAEDYRLVHSGCNLGVLVGSPVDETPTGTDTSDLKPVKTLSLKEVRDMTRTILVTPQPCVPQVALLKHYSFLCMEVSKMLQVPKGAFSEVRKLGELADRLEVDCRHEGVTQPYRNEAESLIQRFKRERPYLVKNKTARESIEFGILANAEVVDSMIGRAYLETRLGEPEIETQPKKKADSSRSRYARWKFGINPEQCNPNERYGDVTIRFPEREVKASQRFIRAKVMKKNAPVKLQFGCNASRDMEAAENDVWVKGLATIIGWTLSCNNADEEKVGFKCKGGVKERSLEITAEAAVGREWHLRVTFIHCMYD